jgi:hypothetical protein
MKSKLVFKRRYAEASAPIESAPGQNATAILASGG